MKKFRLIRKPRDGSREEHIVIVDDEHAYLLRAQNWRVCRTPCGALSVRRNLRDRGTLYLTHEILGTSRYVYHKNGNGLDCRVENLTFEHTKAGVRMRQLYTLAGCYHPYYSELRP